MQDPTPGIVRIPLTTAQQDQIKGIIQREGEAIELTVEELEDRIVPRLASNHNETVLTLQ
jgi:hypothetical protein